ncbi:MAG: heme biosynthesis protein HemY [Gallionella sp.]|nr:heme biosynthesis protein HemY [Gallionella sp.]
MKYLFWILLLFAAAVALSTVAHNPAYVLVVYPPYRIELAFTLFVVLSLLAFISGYILVRLTLAAVQLPSYVQKYRLGHDQSKSRKSLDEALIAFLEGRYAAAEKASAKAIELGDASALPSIIAARSAHELRDFQKRDAYLSASESQSVGDTTMHLIAKARFMLDQHDPQAALNCLQKLRDRGVKGHVGALSLELRAQQLAGHWDEVLSLLEQLEKRGSIEVAMAEQFRQQAWLEKIRQPEDLAGLTACLKNIPEDFKRRAKVAATAAQALIQKGAGSLAQQLLSDSLNAQWDSELVALYGDCQSGDVVAQIEQAEKWLILHKDDAGLLLALGKLCLHQKLWGKAQSYLEASISVSPSQAAYNALGQLAELVGKSDEANKHYQRAMKLE